MKNGDLLKILRKDGWYVVRHNGGSHTIMRHPTKPGQLTVPIHPGKEVPTGTANSILKQAGLR